MIELYISSNIKISTSKIISLLSLNDVECQIYKNWTTYKCCDNKISIEKGFYICIHNIQNNEFVNKVWNILKTIMNLKCAYVNTDEYKGCVLNWPNVFTKSNCKTSSLVHNEII